MEPWVALVLWVLLCFGVPLAVMDFFLWRIAGQVERIARKRAVKVELVKGGLLARDGEINGK